MICSSLKLSYRSEHAARHALDSLQSRRRRGHTMKRRPVQPYRCRECGEWHLGSRPGRFS